MPAWHRPAGNAWNTARAPRQVQGDAAPGSHERQWRRSPPSPVVMAGQPQGNVIPRSLGWGLVTSFFCVCEGQAGITLKPGPVWWGTSHHRESWWNDQDHPW